MLDIIIATIFLYLMYTIMFAILSPNLKDFIKYEMRDEINLIKKEFNIKNKIFDYLTIAIFLISLPITKWEGY